MKKTFGLQTVDRRETVSFTLGMKKQECGGRKWLLDNHKIFDCGKVCF